MANSSFFKSSGTSSTTETTIATQVQSATNAKSDAQKLATNAHNSQFTLSDGVTGYSALHYKTETENYFNNLSTADPTITLAGDLTGSVTLTDLGDGTLTATVVDDSHNHVIANVDNLQFALDAKAPLASPALTGSPTAPTQNASDNSTKIATTAYVDAQVATEDTIAELNDVTITSLSDNELLQYDTASSKWINQTLAEAGIQPTLTFGKSDTNSLKLEEDVLTNDVLLMGTNHVKGKTYAEFKTDIGLNNVENTALSTFSGSSNITTVGTLGQDLTLKTNDGAILTLQTSDTTVEAGDSLGEIHFQAPDEADGTPENTVVSKIINKASTYNFGQFNDTVISEFDFQTTTGFFDANATPASRFTISAGEIKAKTRLFVNPSATGDAIIINNLDTSISSSQNIGNIIFTALSEADGGVADNYVANISAQAQEDFDATHANTRLVFSTLGESTNVVERLRIGNEQGSANDFNTYMTLGYQSGSNQPYGTFETRKIKLRDSTGFQNTLSFERTSTNNPTTNAQLGIINFSAPFATAGGDAILPSALITAKAESDFSATNNSTYISFCTATSDTVDDTTDERFRIGTTGSTFSGDVLFDSTNSAFYDLNWDSSEGKLKFNDSARAEFGNDADMYITSTGTFSRIMAESNVLQIAQNKADKDVQIQTDDGSGGLATYIKCDGSEGEVQLSHYNSIKLTTKATGVDVTGTVTDDGATHDGDVTFTGANYNAVWDKSDNALEFADNAKATFGTGRDLQFYHTGVNSILENYTGDMYIQNFADDKDIIIRSDNGSGGATNYLVADGSTGEVQLNHLGSTKLTTKSTGVDVTGNVTCTRLLFDTTTIGDFNQAIGTDALANVDPASAIHNTAIGNEALNSVTVNDFNVGIGYRAGKVNNSQKNTIVGVNAYKTDATGYENTIVGYDAGSRVSASSMVANTCVGVSAGNGIYSGDTNTIVGAYANNYYNNSSSGTAIGVRAKSNHQNCTSVGRDAGYSMYSQSDYHTLIGAYAGYDLDGGDYNTFIGVQSGYNGGTGHKNTATGHQTHYAMVSGNNNTALGFQAGRSNNSGDNNTTIGFISGYDISSGDNNTLIGYSTGRANAGNNLQTGSNNILLGNLADASSSSVSNSIVLGNSSITSLTCNVQTISALSDQRDKTAIEDLDIGLDFIKKMRPVKYTWNRRDGTFLNRKDLGFIAQELHEVEMDFSTTDRTRMVNFENPSKLTASPMQSYPILIKAIQELSEKVDSLQAEVTKLKNGG